MARKLSKKELSAKISEGMRLSHARRKNVTGGGSVLPLKKTDLSFTREIHGERKKGWTLDLARRLVEAIQSKMIDIEYGGFKWNGKLAKQATGFSELSCRAFLTELRKADEAGMGLEQMFKAGRPFRTGAKVLA